MKGQNPGQGGGGANSNLGSESKSGSCSSNPTPRFPHQLSPKNKNKKNSIEVKIVDGQIILRVTRDDMPFFIDEMTTRKKIYHAPDFDVALPDNLDLEYVKIDQRSFKISFRSRYSVSEVCWRISEKTW